MTFHILALFFPSEGAEQNPIFILWQSFLLIVNFDLTCIQSLSFLLFSSSVKVLTVLHEYHASPFCELSTTALGALLSR
jgi:hypothetical protein